MKQNSVRERECVYALKKGTVYRPGVMCVSVEPELNYQLHVATVGILTERGQTGPRGSNIPVLANYDQTFSAVEDLWVMQAVTSQRLSRLKPHLC